MAYVTTAEFKTFTKITKTDATRDSFIGVLIARAEKIVNRYCDVVTFEANPTTTKFTSDWDYKEWLYLPIWKADSVTSIITYEMDSDNAISYTFLSADWYLDADNSGIRNNIGNQRNIEIRVI